MRKHKGKFFMKKKKNIILRIFFAIIGLLIAVIAVAGFIFRNEIRTLCSIKKLDDYGMYQMTYYGNYNLDELLEQGVTSDLELQDYIIKELTHGIPIHIDVVGDGCTAFVYTDENGKTIMGRNFDFTYSPSMQVFTNPDDGYSSVSTVNLSFAGYGEDNLPDSWTNSFLALSAPYLTFDGMNEKGVCVCSLAVPDADTPVTGKPMINTSVAMRLILDKAASVDEAIELLK